MVEQDAQTGAVIVLVEDNAVTLPKQQIGQGALAVLDRLGVELDHFWKGEPARPSRLGSKALSMHGLRSLLAR
jgi:hypothetical protein